MSVSAYVPELAEIDSLSHVIRLLGEPNRLNMLYCMGLECRPVAALVEATGMTQTNVSFHLRALREAGLVRSERRGPFIYYCLSDPDILRILHELRHWIAGIQQPVFDGEGHPHE